MNQALEIKQSAPGTSTREETIGRTSFFSMEMEEAVLFLLLISGCPFSPALRIKNKGLVKSPGELCAAF